ncbi:MAG: molecular chaperone TorD family protein [Rubrivivax sp.]|nr:molecular chaperone TorD family protein [Rubrivivax sp.]
MNVVVGRQREGALSDVLPLEAQVLLLDLLRRLFLQGPNQGMVDALAAAAALDACEWTPAAADALQRMRQAIASRGDGPDALLDLEVEFTRLTIGPFEIPALPYASFYLSPSRALMTEETLDVRRRYLQAGVAVRELDHTPDDHLGVELEFLHFLSLQALQAAVRDDMTAYDLALERRAEFVREHAARWMPQFAQALSDATQDEVFRAAAALLRQVMRLDEDAAAGS